MKVVLLINLLLNLPLYAQSNQKRIILARNGMWICIHNRQSILESIYSLPSVILLFIHRVLEVTRQGFDFLDLLSQICSQSAQLVDNVALNVSGFRSFGDRVFMVIA